MLSDPLDPATHMPRSRSFWLVPGGLILAQLAALWMVCGQAVEQAEVRQARNGGGPVAMEAVAAADCHQYIPGSAVTGCASRRDHEDGRGLPPQRLVDAAATGGTIPIKYYSL